MSEDNNRGAMKAEPETIYLVDDDPGVRKAISRVLCDAGWRVETFESAEAFLAGSAGAQTGCLLLDVAMPGLDGLELQLQMSAAGQHLPIVFLSGHGDIPMSVRAMKAGASDFLQKPISADALIDAVRDALGRDSSSRATRAELADLEQRLSSLTSREREVLAGIARGRLNKQIAGDLGIVEQTVKFHRARIMKRMNALTVAELMHIVARLGVKAATLRGEAVQSGQP